MFMEYYWKKQRTRCAKPTINMKLDKAHWRREKLGQGCSPEERNQLGSKSDHGHLL